MSFSNLGKPFERYERPGRTINRVFIHCDASSNPNTTVQDIHRWHKERGWSGIGYHIFIDNAGRGWHGRDLESPGAHTSGYNTGTLGICVNGLHLSDFTEAQFDELRRICNQINEAHGGGMRFSEHNDVAAKACPVFDAYAVLGLDSKGYMDGDVRLPPSTIPMLQMQVNLAQVGLGDRHGDVAMIQRLLEIKADGIFGAQTEAKVKEYQRAQDLAADGIVGRATWERLLGVGN
jgi:peptidoglycan hydrolase-like protein with peptidoglycan-binding domain